MSAGSHVLGYVWGMAVGAFIFLPGPNTLQVKVPEGISVKKGTVAVDSCALYKDFAEKANPYIIAGKQSAKVKVETGSGQTCEFQHVPPTPVTVAAPGAS